MYSQYYLHIDFFSSETFKSVFFIQVKNEKERLVHFSDSEQKPEQKKEEKEEEKDETAVTLTDDNSIEKEAEKA